MKKIVMITIVLFTIGFLGGMLVAKANAQEYKRPEVICSTNGKVTACDSAANVTIYIDGDIKSINIVRREEIPEPIEPGTFEKMTTAAEEQMMRLINVFYGDNND